MPDAEVINPICAGIGNPIDLLETAVQNGNATRSGFKALVMVLDFYASHSPRRLHRDLASAVRTITDSENALLQSSPMVAGTDVSNDLNTVVNTDCSGYGYSFNPPSGIVPP